LSGFSVSAFFARLIPPVGIGFVLFVFIGAVVFSRLTAHALPAPTFTL
jgi:hypothetical protein